MANKEMVELIESRVLSFLRREGFTIYYATNYQGMNHKISGKDFSRQLAPYLEGVIRRAK